MEEKLRGLGIGFLKSPSMARPGMPQLAGQLGQRANWPSRQVLLV